MPRARHPPVKVLFDGLEPDEHASEALGKSVVQLMGRDRLGVPRSRADKHTEAFS
jgi:hypothetical protein